MAAEAAPPQPDVVDKPEPAHETAAAPEKAEEQATEEKPAAEEEPAAEKAEAGWKRWALYGGLAVGNLLQVAVVFWTPLGRVFHTTPFGLDVVVALGLVGSLVLWAEEARKLLLRRRVRRLLAPAQRSLPSAYA